MSITDTIYEEVLKGLLQKNLKFTLNGRAVKQGKFYLYKQNNYFITLFLQTKKKADDKLEIPIPFKIEKWNNEELMYFDYRLSTLVGVNDELENLFKVCNRTDTSKYHNNILEIEVIPYETT